MYTYGNTMLFGFVLVIIILIFATVSFNADCGTIRNRNSSDTYFTQFLWNILHVDIGTHSSTCLLNTANTVLMLLVNNQLLYHKV